MKYQISKGTKQSKPKKRMAALLLVFALVTGLSGVTASFTEPNPYVVEAKAKKKDKKKPVIKFSGKTKMTVEKGKSVKIPKVTAKDNKDGNVTKKLKVTVKKGKKKYNSIVKAVKKNKKTKFTSTGTYKITYTVKDKAGNKATKTRTVKVVAPKKKTTTKTPTTTQQPTTQRPTTEKITTEKATTEVPTTEKITTEQPTTEQPTVVLKDLPEPVVGDSNWKWHAVVLNNDIYIVVNDPDYEANFFDLNDGTYDDYLPEKNPNVKINIENDYEYIMLSRNSGLIGNAEYLKYLGEVSGINRYGNPLTMEDHVTFYSPFNKNNVKSGPNNIAYIYIDGNLDQVMIPVYLNIVDFDKNKNYDENSFKSEGYELLSKNPLVYGKKR